MQMNEFTSNTSQGLAFYMTWHVHPQGQIHGEWVANHPPLEKSTKKT